MNERIKDLAEQAGFVLWQDEPWRPTDVIDWSSRYDDELKKFAELIVEECAGIADIERDTSAGCGYVTQTTGQRIKKHFGVEE